MPLGRLSSWLLDRPLRSKMNLVFTVPMILIVIATLMLTSRFQITRLETQKIDATRSLVVALSQDFQRIELLQDSSHRSDMATRLRALPDFEYLVVFDHKGERFFYFNRPDLPILSTPPPPVGTAMFSTRHLHLHQSLADLGTDSSVYVRTDASDVRAKARHDILMIFTLGLVLMAVALLSSATARTLIVQPVEALAGLSQRVAREKDYALRAKVARSDEIGSMAHGVNHLLEETQRHLAELRAAALEREALITRLEAKNAELEQFNYTVSHDLTSPLVTIRGFAGLLERDLAEGSVEGMKRDLARINGAAERMGLLLKDLLDLSRVGRIINPPQEVVIGDLVTEALELLAGKITLADAHIHVAPNLPSVSVDAPRMVEVFQNLIENALKFTTGQSSPDIEIGGRRESGQVVCHVKDNGLGIEQCYQEKIFGLFERLDQEIEGTGIGLALIKRIIEVHGGRLWVESEGLGKGSTFFFSIPEAATTAGTPAA